MSDQLELRGILRGHNGWVTQISTNYSHPNIIISSSRDKSLIIWKITEDNNNCGIPHKRLKGHGHFVSDCTTSIDGTHALSASWDKTMRLWDLNTGVSIKRFVGHKNDVTSVSMSADSRIIASGSRDKTVKIWNTNGDKKFEFEDHTEWVSAVSFLPNETRDLVSAGWDKQVNLWNMYRCRLKSRYVGHRHQVNALTVSPDGNVCLSGSKDGKILMWDTTEHKCLTMMDNNESVESLAINPTKNFMSSTCGPAIKLWDLDHKTLVDEIRPGVTASRSLQPDFISQAWSTDGTTLYAGYTDGNIRVYKVTPYT
ncbi:GNB2L1 [Cordylochernes scorpioides]|uniref:Small ribosomal subunit protein RACK1 n=1 Tax=Cordylochernes scorpioides TaxID=51811 RepID=A0ABY6L2V7_9ARAC|nr:GNB2L1 [Cordylochernes scorpioides]